MTARKQKTVGKYARLDEGRIQVVVEEIESWYLAGLDDERSEKLGMRRFRATDTVSKEQFDALIPGYLALGLTLCWRSLIALM